MNTTWVDLADRRLGGLVLSASDEWFAPKEQLLEATPAVFDPDSYSTRGKLMDGWETRRHSPTGDDWVILRLGAPGIVRRAIVDTSHFRGNAPQRCALDGYAAADPLLDDARAVEWIPLLDWSQLRPDHVNAFELDPGPRVTHVRLRIAPDGGVARLRLLGEVVTDLRTVVDRHNAMDLASSAHGGVAEATSGEFFSPAQHLLQLGDARNMGDGWETRRRRDGGHDWVVVRLATTGLVERVEVDTTHFLGNHPQSCAVDACHRPARGDQLAITDEDWREVVPTTPLGQHARHVFDVTDPQPATHVRLRIHPDGGVARLRVRGRVTDEGWRRAGVRWLDAATEAEARAAFAHCCGASRWVEAMLARRPFATFDRLREAADHEWEQLGHDDWFEAFSAHPRIGDRSGPEHTRREQSGTADADPEVLEALAEGNRRYERRFEHVFLINAAGRSAEEMLEALTERLDNDPATEAAVAAEQQRQITQRRLEAMVHPDRGD
ncbi:MAG: allantoicase [Actinobacteria bacterium]|nr:allantoicase [Actinomycetota bacterium]